MTLLLKSFRTIFPDIKYTCQISVYCIIILLSSDSKCNETSYSVITPYIIYFFDKKKLVLYCIMLRVIPLGLALLYRYYPLTLENILGLVLLLLL